jgi:hypothetical protein
MSLCRYIVRDDVPHDRTLGLTADQFAEALRSPMAAIGVRVVRQRGVASDGRMAGFQARGFSRTLYFSKRNEVELVITGVMTRSVAIGDVASLPLAATGLASRAAMVPT